MNGQDSRSQNLALLVTLYRGIKARPDVTHVSDAGCFRCVSCKQPISEGRLMQRDNEPYHPQCFREAHHPRCSVCRDYLPEEVITIAMPCQIL